MTDAALLAALPGVAYGFMLLLARLGALIMVVPGFGEGQFPAPIRAGFAVVLCALLLPGLMPVMPAMPTGNVVMAAQLAAELVTGLWLGWLVRLVALALPSAAGIMAFMIGLSSVIAPDTNLGQTTALSRLFGLVPTLLVLVSGLYIVPLAAVAGSYRLIPPGALLPAGDATEMMLRSVADSFSLAVRLAAPFILAGTVWQIALGIVARLVPSLQIYNLAMPGQLGGGLLLLAVTLPALLAAWMDVARIGLAPFGP